MLPSLPTVARLCANAVANARAIASKCFLVKSNTPMAVLNFNALGTDPRRYGFWHSQQPSATPAAALMPELNYLGEKIFLQVRDEPSECLRGFDIALIDAGDVVALWLERPHEREALAIDTSADPVQAGPVAFGFLYFERESLASLNTLEREYGLASEHE